MVKSIKNKIKQESFWRIPKILEGVSKISIYLLTFLLPLFFLPWTVDVLDFNKQILLYFLVFISLFCWLLKFLIEGKINLNFNFFNLLVIIFLIVTAISTGFSFYQYGSFWGWPLNVVSSFLTILSFIFLYFLIINIFQKKEIFWLLLVLASSSFLVSLFGIFQIFGNFFLPFDFSRLVSFNTIGTINSLGIFGALVLPITFSLFFISQRFIKFLLLIFGLGIFLLIFVVNFWLSWIILLIGIATILIFGISRKEIFRGSWITLSMFFLIIAVLFGFLKISLPGLPAIPLELAPSQKITFDIALQTLKQSPISLILGSGPGTFIYDYSKFKSKDINQTAFWTVRFSSGASEILDKLTTTGILGLISFLAILGLFFYLGLKEIIKEIKNEEKIEFYWILKLGIFSSWLTTTITFFLYPSNLSLGFLFWIFTALFIVILSHSKIRTWQAETSSLANTGFSFIFIFILILGIGICFLISQRFLAEIKYLQALKAVQRGDNQNAINYLLSAISNTDKKQDNYWRDISQIYLFRINEEFLKVNLSQEELLKNITPLISEVVESAKMSTEASPKNVTNWTVRGFVYRNLINLIHGADEWAIKSYEKALELEPTNPYILNEIGQIYLAKNELNKAKEQFQRTLDLKPDYAPAHFQIAMVYVQEGKTKEAIDRLETLKQTVPFDQGLAFQLGLIYYNDNQFDKAEIEFQRAVFLDPNYSNARYFLGLVYDKKGEKQLAIEHFERIAQLNPDNEEVKKILANLKENKPALEGIFPSQPPIEEKPPEKLEKEQ